jgi:hypothetical protein
MIEMRFDKQEKDVSQNVQLRVNDNKRQTIFIIIVFLIIIIITKINY